VRPLVHPQRAPVALLRAQVMRSLTSLPTEAASLHALLRLLPAGVNYLLRAVWRLHVAQQVRSASATCARGALGCADASLAQRRCAELALRVATVSCERTRRVCTYLARGASAVRVAAQATAA
jgi:hypothetical protein